jgi:hypothetical protein
MAHEEENGIDRRHAFDCVIWAGQGCYDSRRRRAETQPAVMIAGFRVAD